MMFVKQYLVLMLLALLVIDSESWWFGSRRRRRSPPPCYRRNCQVSGWSVWSKCSHRCGNAGTQYRTRAKTTTEACGGTCPYSLREQKNCNRNACKNGGTPLSGRCSCRARFNGTCCESVLKIEGTIKVHNKYLALNGTAHIKFLEPQERVWAGLSKAHRFPVIHSGNRIALRVLYSGYATKWIRCSSSSYCSSSTCPGDKIMSTSKWSTCTYEQFYIRAINKNDNKTILSGDYVTLAPYRRGSNCRLRCFSSTSTKCNSATCVSESSFKGNNAFAYSYLTFQIFSRNGKDGIDPIQYGDTVAFRYPYYNAGNWLYFNGSYLYARSCSRNNKASCAYKGNRFGFQIFKRL